MESKVEVSLAELTTAAERWYDGLSIKLRGTHGFLRWLGEDPVKYGVATVWVSEDSARKIRLLNSEHYHTVIAAYKAQNYIK